MELEHETVTKEIIGAAFEVHNFLGYGFLEKVYQKAMLVELQQRKIKAVLETAINVLFKGYIVGDYYADLLVEEKIIVEIKVADKYNPKDEAQLINELKATGIRVGMLINFGKEKVEFKRLVYSEKSVFNQRTSVANNLESQSV